MYQAYFGSNSDNSTTNKDLTSAMAWEAVGGDTLLCNKYANSIYYTEWMLNTNHNLTALQSGAQLWVTSTTGEWLM